METKEKRLVCVRITSELSDTYWKSGKNLFSIFSNIPDDTKFVRSRTINTVNAACIEFILESSEFAPLTVGNMIPTVCFTTKPVQTELRNGIRVVPNVDVKLGDPAVDTITNFVGIVTARCEYISGCTQFCITPKCDKDGKYMNGCYFDIDRVMKIFVPPLEHENANTKKFPPGGPQQDTPSTE